MDKQFENVIEKMDEQSNKAVELQKHVTTLFTKVESTQKDIDKESAFNSYIEKVTSSPSWHSTRDYIQKKVEPKKKDEKKIKKNLLDG